MGYKLNVRGASDWVNLLKDLYVEVDNTNWSSGTLSGFLDEVQTALDGKKSRNVVKTLLNMTASAYDVILVDTTSTVDITLPLTASQGDEVYITDVTANASNQNITVVRNGHKINGLDENLILDVDFSSVKLIYDAPSNGWHIDAGGSYFGADNSDINDPFITLNADFTTGTPTENGGMIIKRGDSDDVLIRWNETIDKWELTNDGTTFETILTSGNVGAVDHGDLSGLANDDHTQYMHVSTDRTVTATHTFNPDSVGAPFEVGTNANKQLVEGLNAEYVNGILVSTMWNDDPTSTTAGDVWFQDSTFDPNQ